MIARPSTLLERDGELAEIAGRVERLLSAGAGGVLLIEGPPGIGKTALLDQALAGVRDGVLRARGSELESGLAFGAVRQLLIPPLRQLARPQRDELLDGPARLAARVLGFGSATDGPEFSDPLFSLYWLLAELAERRSLVVAIEDLHWLDEESGRFVGYLARRLEGEPILILATARSHEPGATTPVATLAQVGEVLRPPPLSPTAVGRLIAGRDVEAVHRATGGNPLLVTQLAQAPSDVPLEQAAPAGIGAMVLERVERVSEAAGRLARAVSLFPDGARLEDAAAVAGLDAAEAAAAADGLVAAQVFEGQQRLGFLHPLMRAAVYDRLGAFARRSGHAAAARVLRDRGAPLETVVAHLLNGAPENDAESVRLLRRAAAAAVAAAAPRAAIRYLERALDEPVAGETARFEVLFELGRLRGRVAREDAADALRQAAEAAPQPHGRVEASLHLAAVLLAGGHNRDALALLEQLRGSELDAEQTLLADGMTAACALELERPELFVDTVRRLSPHLTGGTPGQRLALMWRWYADYYEGMQPAEAFGRLVRCLADDGSVVFAEYGLTTFDPAPGFLLLGAFDTLERLAADRMETARERGDEALYLVGLASRAASRQLRGHWRAAEVDARQVADHPSATIDQRITALESLIEALARQGRCDEGEQALAQLAALGAARERLELRRAVLAEARGDRDGFEPFKQVSDRYVTLGFAHPAQRRWLCSYADGLVRAGRSDEAREVMEQYLHEAEPSGDPAAIGHALTVLGRIERGPRAVERLERAVAVIEPSPHEWLLGWARLELGAALRRDNRRADARGHLRRALGYAEQHGEAALLRRGREELKLAGGRTREARSRDRDALTPAEERVARHAAAGLSNKQIAAELFLTVGSVQTTLIRVYRKLGIDSRRDLEQALGAA